ncbi:MAG TPA: hypothetical protein EYH27_03690 [Anaerolineales bacterium]|nr:hypothetical protein [Anaerolineae bacterium]HIP87523.1 hypothetical protein [Anaerolineales bacterium]
MVAVDLSESAGFSVDPAVAAAGARAYVLWEEDGAIRACRGFTLLWTSPITLSTPGVTATGAEAAIRGGPLHTAWDEGSALRTGFGWLGSSTVLAQDAAGVREVALDVGSGRLLHAVWSQGASGSSDVYYTYRRLAWTFLPVVIRTFPGG